MLLDSESMVASFRQMLRGLSDGEILLDSKLRVVGKAESLRTAPFFGRCCMMLYDFGPKRAIQIILSDLSETSESLKSSTAIAKEASHSLILVLSLGDFVIFIIRLSGNSGDPGDFS